MEHILSSSKRNIQKQQQQRKKMCISQLFCFVYWRKPCDGATLRCDNEKKTQAAQPQYKWMKKKMMIDWAEKRNKNQSSQPFWKSKQLIFVENSYWIESIQNTNQWPFPATVAIYNGSQVENDSVVRRLYLCASSEVQKNRFFYARKCD